MGNKLLTPQEKKIMRGAREITAYKKGGPVKTMKKGGGCGCGK